MEGNYYNTFNIAYRQMGGLSNMVYLRQLVDKVVLSLIVSLQHAHKRKLYGRVS